MLGVLSVHTLEVVIAGLAVCDPERAVYYIRRAEDKEYEERRVWSEEYDEGER